MTGLEKILKHIEDDAHTTVDHILAEANTKAEEIMADARLEGEKKCAEITERSKLEVQSCLSRAESAANLQEKKMILTAKQEIIGEVINHAKDTLINLPDREYFEIIVRMVGKYALEQSGQILFSAKDKKRLPDWFHETLSAALTGTNGYRLTTADETADIDGGFILEYGDIEINCSIEALFAAARDILQDKVSEVLFE